MKATFVQLGQAIDFIPSRDVAKGEILVCNGMAGAVKLPVRAGEMGALHLTGVYDVDKARVSIKAGDRVYLNRDGLAATGADGGIYLGVASCNSPGNAAKVRVILNFGHPEGTGGESSESIQWQTMS